jgi:hypothetical protein
MLAAISFFVLRVKKNLPRLLQTFSALIGVNVITTTVSLPLYNLGIGSDGAGSYSLLIYLVQIWNLAVLSLIFKRAFEISTQLSAMISFSYFFAYLFTAYWLFF